MQKKIVAVSLVILMVALLLASCGNKYLMGEINGVERPLVTDAEGNTEIDNEGKIAGIQILQISDTAGLGMKAQTDSFKDQFKGLVSGIKVAKNSADHDSNEILALTGATITSNAVTTAVNEALENFKTITENGGAN